MEDHPVGNWVQVRSEVAPVNENVVTGDAIDITVFPAPKMWHHHGGRYIGTGDVVITKDPEDGHYNLGTYRQMILNRKQVGFYISPGKDAFLQREKWWLKGNPCEVAAVYGTDPTTFICGSLGFPSNVSEYDAIGGIMGRPVEVCKSRGTGLLYPSNAEIVIEGVAYPENLQPEGPPWNFWRQQYAVYCYGASR